MVNTDNGMKPFSSKPGKGMGTWDLHIYYTAVPGDCKSAIINGVCIGD